MMNNRRVFLTAAACLCLLSTPALAGKPTGGSKRDPILHVQNNIPIPVGVLINPTDEQLDALQDNPTIDQFMSIAGESNILSPGVSADFTVHAGNLTVYFLDLSEEDVVDRLIAQEVYKNVRKGQTVKVYTGNL